MGPLLVLVLVRGLQLRTYGPVFHQGEWLNFSELAQAWRYGSEVDRGLIEALRHYTYESFSQGVLLVQLGTALFGLLIENLTVCLFLVALSFELIGLGTFLALGRRLEASVWPAAAAWILAPSFVVIWQMLPYGNHTAFWFVASLMGLWLLRPPGSRLSGPAPLVFLAFGGVLAYRPVLIPVIALVLVLAMRREGSDLRSIAALVGGAVAALLVGVTLFGDVGTDGHAALARFKLSADGLHLRAFWLGQQFGAPRDAFLGHLVRLIGLAAIPAAAWFGWRDRARPAGALALFFALYAFGATLAPQLSSEAAPEYALPAWFARLGCLATIFWTVPGVRRVAGGLLLGLALCGVSDGLGLIKPSAWTISSGYDGVALRAVVSTDHVDPDDLPYLLDLANRIEPAPHAGWVLDHPRSGCGWRSWRWPTDPLVDPVAGICTGWSRGDLGEEVVEALRANPDMDLAVVGALAWVLANRQLDQVAEAMAGAPEPVVVAVVAGARTEARRWSEAPTSEEHQR